MRAAKKKKSFFSTRLIQLRESYGLNQADFATHIGVPKHHINYLECRGTNPRMQTVQRIADALGVPTEYFVNEDFESGMARDPNLTCLKQIRELVPEKQAQLRQIIQEFLDENS